MQVLQLEIGSVAVLVVNKQTNFVVNNSSLIVAANVAFRWESSTANEFVLHYPIRYSGMLSFKNLGERIFPSAWVEHVSLALFVRLRLVDAIEKRILLVSVVMNAQPSGLCCGEGRMLLGFFNLAL
mgnify:CR=1 FL=1